MRKGEERPFGEKLENEHEYNKEFEDMLGEEGSWRHGVVCPKGLCKLRPRVVLVLLVNVRLKKE